MRLRQILQTDGRRFRCRKPTKPERTMAEILGDEFRYVGDGQLMLGGMNPDFVHRTQPLVVEVFGNYWHRGEDPSGRIAKFERLNYACAVFWESELND